MVELKNITKTYRTRRGDVQALRDVNLRIEKGEFVVLCGPSGSGKTTLLMTVAAMLRPTAGTVCVEQRDLYAMSIRDRAKFRARNIGFVFQMFHLVPYLNIVENVLLARHSPGGSPGRLGPLAGGPSAASGGTEATKRQAAEELLKRFGLAERASHKPAELSAGEKQRAAMARALFNRPRIILADEPTGNLDPANAESVLGHLFQFHRDGGTVIVATHGPTAGRFADRVIYLRNGGIEKAG
jgi:ABC-type lipoprotein export system ATPase subunit